MASTTSTLLTNFPFLVNTTIAALKDTSNSGHVAKSNGGDILFTTSDGVTKLNHEIEKYSPATGELIAWVQVPTISTSTDTGIYMYYGNASAADQWNVNATWDSNYKGVWHLNDPTNPTDSTGVNNGTNNGATVANGIIDGGVNYNGTGQKITIGTNTSLSLNGSSSISVWFKKLGNYGGNDIYHTLITRLADDLSGYLMTIYGTNNTFGFWNNGWNFSSYNLADSNWHQYYIVSNGTVSTFYVDGVFKGTTSHSLSNSSESFGAYGFPAIGALGSYGWANGNEDEVRVSNSARSADWIKTEYNNQSSPSTFYSIASENSQPTLISRPMMSSDNYQIKTDSINFGGSENSIYGDLVLSDTLGEIGTGNSSSSNYGISAGYRNLQSSYISISSAPNITMPPMSGMIAGESNSSESWLVVTDNAAGYQMTARAMTSPALQSPTGGSFSDYVPSNPNVPDYIFSIGAASSTFAFSPEGIDISQKYLDNGLGSACGTGNTDTQDRCWDGFSTSDKVVSYRTSSNHPNGTITTLKYKTAIGANKIQESGTYTSTIVVTAVAL